MRNERVLVLLLPGDVVRLSDHFRGPPHGLPARNHQSKIVFPEAGPSNAPGYSRALAGLR